MPMFIEIFLMLCIIAQPQVCVRPQPLPKHEEIPAESGTVDRKSIFSLITRTGNCYPFEDFWSDPKFRQLEEYCERPLPGTPRTNGFLSYEVVLCMVLYDAVQRVCKVENQELTKDIQNVSGGFSCDAMIKGVSEAFAEPTKQWVTLFNTKLGKVSDCERACIQNNTISPVCEYIWKTNTLTYQAQVSSAISTDISPTEKPQVTSKGHGKTDMTKTSKDAPLEAKTLDLSSAAGSRPSILNNGGQNIEQVDHTMTPTNASAVHKDVDLAEANGGSTQSGSANDVKINVKEKAHTKDSNVQNDFKKQAQATLNTGHNDAKKQAHAKDSNVQNDLKKQTQATFNTRHNDAKKQAHTAGNNAQNDINKQAHGTNSNVQDITKKQEHARNSSNQSAEVTPHNASVSLTERTSEAGKYDDSTGKRISSSSKSNTALQSENKSSVGVDASDPDTENQNDDNEEFIMPNDENANTGEDTAVADNTPSGNADKEKDNKNIVHQEEQSEKMRGIENDKELEETSNTVQFNQLGDAADSHFYAYFMTMVVICIIGYLVFHNKQKILALALEGRSRRGTRRRPNTSAYRKLDSNLEEAVTSTGSTSVTHVIY